MKRMAWARGRGDETMGRRYTHINPQALHGTLYNHRTSSFTLTKSVLAHFPTVSLFIWQQPTNIALFNVRGVINIKLNERNG